PETVTDCNCSICRRYGVLWAYYRMGQVRVVAAEGALDDYVRSGGELAFRRCATCGCVTQWVAADGAGQRTGVNARLMDPAVLAKARVRRLDGADTWRYLDEDAGGF